MDGLRWLLLLFGALVIAGVYFYSRRERQAKTQISTPEREPHSTSGERVEPSLDSPSGEPQQPTDAPDAPVEDSPEVVPEGKQKIVTLRLVARSHSSFAGDELILGLRNIGLRHGKFGIFHRYDSDNEKRIVFSAASLVEPGSFDLTNIKGQQIPGISMFLVLPGPVDGAKAFDLMMTSGRELSRALNGELLDESGSTMSVQRERYLREEIIQYQHGIKVA